jgi:uncharacterized membrane protein YhaH (DUF805 family)
LARSFNLVLTGRVLAGFTRQAAADALGKMMRLPDGRALELLAGKETVIKRNLDDAALARYLGALGPIGVEVRADEILQAPVPAPVAPAAPAAKPQPTSVPVQATPVAVETIKCPACGAEQPRRNLCRQCGGDIRRLLAAKHEPVSSPAQGPSSVSPRSGAATLPGSVWVEQGSITPHPLNVFSFEGRIGRLRYLAYAFPAYLPVIGAVVLGALLGRSMVLFSVLLILGGLATFALGVRIAVLRLHDLNLSGKWVLLPLVPLLAIFTGSLVLMIGSTLFLILGTLALSFWPGNMMSNDYGPPPGPNTIWIIVGAVLFILLCLVGGFTGGSPRDDAESPEARDARRMFLAEIGRSRPVYLAAALTTPSLRPRACCLRRGGLTRSRMKLGSANTPSWVSPL